MFRFGRHLCSGCCSSIFTTPRSYLHITANFQLKTTQLLKYSRELFIWPTITIGKVIPRIRNDGTEGVSGDSETFGGLRLLVSGVTQLADDTSCVTCCLPLEQEVRHTTNYYWWKHLRSPWRHN